jgi:hypothetical protein
MKTTTVPAQVTTVEDRITSNLTLLQIVLLMLPVFIDFIIYASLPKSFKLSILKVSLAVLVTSLLWTMSIRYKDKVIFRWLLLIGRYSFRPRFYVHIKTPVADWTQAHRLTEPALNINIKKLQAVSNFSNSDELKANEIMSSKNLKVVFVAGRKARLNIHAAEIK